MKYVLLSVLLFVISGLAPVAAIDAEFVDDTRSYLSRLEKLGFAGVVTIAENGTPVLAEGYGFANREMKIRWSTSSVATIGSITKQFTAAAILVLQERGSVNVTDGLDKYFSGVPEDKAEITLHQLLTHSSGIIDPPDIDDFDANTRDEYVTRVLETPLDSQPGERFEYANANYSLLGAIIELKTGKSYEAAMRELVFDPAGLKETGYTKPAWDGDRIVQGYEGSERWGTVLERPMAEDGPYWALRANGGIYSTSTDMLKWAQALLDDRVLSPKSREMMWIPHVDETNGDGDSWYGYGWVVLQLDDGSRLVTHNGGNGILFADFAIVPEKNIVAFLQTNVVADFRTANGLLEEISMRLFGGVPYPEVPDVIDVAPAVLESWQGVYRFSNGERIDVTVDGGAIRVVPTGWSAYAWVHSGTGLDPAPLVKKSETINQIVGAYTRGDFAPLFEAYGGQVSIERLKSGYENRVRQREAEYGPYRGYEVLGTGTGEQYQFTVVSFYHENETLLRAYVWALDEENKLLGMTTRRMESGCRFFPVKSGGYQSWEPATGASAVARMEKTDHDASFVLIREDGMVIARRTRNAR